MNPQIITVLIAVGALGLFFMLMSVRILLKKNGEFQGTCASQSPFLNKEGVVCSLCGKDPNSCDNKETTNLGGLPAIGNAK